jgi:transposase
MALVDALGNLVRFVLMPGQRNDIMGVRPLIEGLAFDALLADKAFDANWRHLVENYFAKIKEFRGIATRYDKTDDSFRANINLTATLIACR